MTTVPRPSPSEREKRKKAKRFFTAALKRLKRTYKAIKTVDQWYEFVQQIESMLPEYEDVLSPVDAQRLKAALQLADTSHEGISRAIDVLEFELDHVVNALPSGGALGLAIAGVAVLTAVGVGAASAALNASAVPILIRNNGCAPIPICQGVLPALDWLSGAVGIDLPKRPIQSGSQDTLTFPPLAITLDATARNKLNIEIWGIALPFSVGVDVDSIQFDGQEILGLRTPIDLKRSAYHELTVTCH